MMLNTTIAAELSKVKGISTKSIPEEISKMIGNSLMEPINLTSENIDINKIFVEHVQLLKKSINAINNKNNSNLFSIDLINKTPLLRLENSFNSVPEFTGSISNEFLFI